MPGEPAPASPNAAVFLGLDYGARRIGMAIGDSLTRSARPLPVVANGRQPDWDALQRALHAWEPHGWVIGLPLALDGSDQMITRHTRAFADLLVQRFGLPVHWCDERLTSRAADGELRDARASGRMTRRVQSGDRDGIAARLILEQWLASLPKPAAPDPAPGAAPGFAAG